MSSDRQQARKPDHRGAQEWAPQSKDWASLGAEVCVADINEEGIATVAEEIRAAEGTQRISHWM